MLIQDDLRRTIYFAQQQREMFLQTLRKNAATRTEKELKEYSKEIKTSEERIERLDKIIETERRRRQNSRFYDAYLQV